MSQAADFEADALVFVRSQDIQPDVFVAHDPIMIVKAPDLDRIGLSQLVAGFVGHVATLLAPLERLATAAEQILDRQSNIPVDTGAAAFSADDETQAGPGRQGKAASTLGDSDSAPELRSDRFAKLEEQVAEIRDLLKRQVVSTGATKDWYSVNEVADQTGHKRWTIRQACNTRRIKASKGDDGRWRVHHEELVRLQERGLPAG